MNEVETFSVDDMIRFGAWIARRESGTCSSGASLDDVKKWQQEQLDRKRREVLYQGFKDALTFQAKSTKNFGEWFNEWWIANQHKL